ncbi:MAG: hemerythrin domain-containing protein [Deltaproteobacteria bacterium]|nr:hemerythrin domain-containing protein [Deltaproteobacteria bacterium]MBW2360563.1 hemerythrin domain-containing protein [Deltaproteobacteria bacterium]
MRPEEIRTEVLQQHGAIRDLLARTELAARPIASGDRRNLGPLRARCEQLRERVVRHIDWEDRHLRDALLTANGWGKGLARKLEHDHGEQLRVLEEIAGICRRDRFPTFVAARVLEWAQELRREMQREESAIRDRRAFPASIEPTSTTTG